MAPGGTLLVVAHDHDNLTRGFGGPQDDAVLYSIDDVRDVAEANGLIVQRAEQVVRLVETESGTVTPSTRWSGRFDRCDQWAE